VLVGCLIAVAVVIILLAIGAIYVGMHWKGWAANAVQQMTAAAIKEAGLPKDQQDQILADVRKLGDEFKAGTLTLDQIQKVGAAIAASPLLHLGALQLANQKYIEPSTMTTEEKAAANRSLQRFARGVYEKKITTNTVEDVIKPVITLQPDGSWELKEKPTREELDQFVANAKEKADAAKVPDEPFDLNIAKELHKTINSALGRTGD
jgi:hypothetical protein